MSQVEHFAERSFAIKGTLVFTAQRDQFTIMEDAYLVCDAYSGHRQCGALPQIQQPRSVVGKGHFFGGSLRFHADIGKHHAGFLQQRNTVAENDPDFSGTQRRGSFRIHCRYGGLYDRAGKSKTQIFGGITWKIRTASK